MRPWVGALVVFVLISGWSGAQTLQPRPATPQPHPPGPLSPSLLDLTVPAGTPLKVALVRDLRIRKPGEPVEGRTVEPVYAFDKLVIPAGAAVTGKVSGITPITKKQRFLSALDADLSPRRSVQIEFNRLTLPGGRVLPLQTLVAQNGGASLELVTAPPKPGSAPAVRNAIAKRLDEARQQLRRDWQAARSDIRSPGKIHRLERYALAQLPYRPQYLDAGTTFNAELLQPLDFGSEALPPDSLRELGTEPKPGSIVHAILATPLSSAQNRKGDEVEAVLTEPVFDGPHLIFPQGSRLEGTVLQARPARRLRRNGLLRIAFRQIVLPNGPAETIAASLQAVSAPQAEHLVLDSEGGAQVTTPRTRYFETALTIGLASMSASDHDAATDHGSDPARGAAGGGVGFRAVGMALGTLAHSRPLSTTMAFYGAGLSLYSHFLARGNDVVYPRDTSLVIGIGAPEDVTAAGARRR